MDSIVDLIRSVNPDLDDLADDDILLGELMPLGRTSTSQRVLARYKAPYSGDVLVHYDRLALDTLFRGTIPEVERTLRIPPGPAGQMVVMVSDLLEELSRRVGYLITSDDIIDMPIPKPEGNDPVTGRYQSQVIVVANPTSTRYVGGFTLRWVLGGDKPHISQFFTSTHIRGYR